MNASKLACIIFHLDLDIFSIFRNYITCRYVFIIARQSRPFYWIKINEVLFNISQNVMLRFVSEAFEKINFILPMLLQKWYKFEGCRKWTNQLNKINYFEVNYVRTICREASSQFGHTIALHGRSFSRNCDDLLQF